MDKKNFDPIRKIGFVEEIACKVVLI